LAGPLALLRLLAAPAPLNSLLWAGFRGACDPATRTRQSVL